MKHGHSAGYKVGCDLCRDEAAQAKRELRARKRGLTSVPSPQAESSATVEAPGPVVAAVQADLAGLGELTGWQALSAAAVAMARILDSDGNVPTWPAAAKELTLLLNMLHREAAPKRTRLARVQAMTARSDPGG